MKPKKRILIVGANANRTSVLRFALATTGRYAVEVADCNEAVRELASDRDLELVIALDGLVKEIGACSAPVIRIVSKLTPPLHEPVAAITLASDVAMAELLERICVITARKRGPHKGSKLPVQSGGVGDAARRVA